MPAVEGVRSAHATAGAAAEDIVTLTSGGGLAADIVNRGTANDLFFRLDNIACVAAADETFVVNQGERRRVGLAANGIVRVISTAGTDYSVEVVG